MRARESVLKRWFHSAMLLPILILAACGADDPAPEEHTRDRSTTLQTSPADSSPAGDVPTATTYDPCRLLSRQDVESVLGGNVVVEQAPPQSQTENHCVYKAATNPQQAISLVVNNARGFDPRIKLENDLRKGKSRLEGVGDIATVFHSPGGPSTAQFALGQVGVLMTLSGVAGRETQLPALASTAADRLRAGEVVYQMPGTEAFVGTWLATFQPKAFESWLGIRSLGRLEEIVSLVNVAADGEYRGTTRLEFSGHLLLDGDDWIAWEPGGNRRTPHGTLAVDGDTLELEGDIEAALAHVVCGQAPVQVSADKELLRPLINWSVLHNHQDILPPAGLPGLWEGTARVYGEDARLLLAIGDNSAYTLLVLVDHEGELEAAQGRFVLAVEGQDKMQGQYRLAGGVEQGKLYLTNAAGEHQWQPYTPGKVNPRTDRPLLGYCPGVKVRMK